jgi:hypothetical protein
VGKQIKRAMKETSIYNPMEELNALTVQMENAIRDNDLARMIELSKKQAVASEKLMEVDASEINLADLRNLIEPNQA